MLSEIGQNSTMRVNYASDIWESIIEKLGMDNFTDISVSTRARLVDDAFNLARAGIIHYKIAFRVAQYLAKEREYLPWAAAYRNFIFLLHNFENTDSPQHVLEAFIRSIATPLYEDLGLALSFSDSLMKKRLRNIAIDLACRVFDPKCLEDVAAKMKAPGWATMDINIRSSVCCSAVRKHSDIALTLFQKLHLLKHTGTDPAATQRKFIVHCMACANNTLFLSALTHNSYEDILTTVHAADVRRRVLFNAGHAGVKASLDGLTNWLMPWQDIDEEARRIPYYMEVREYIREICKWIVNTEQKDAFRGMVVHAYNLKFLRWREMNKLLASIEAQDKWSANFEDRILESF